MKQRPQNRYQALVASVFEQGYRKGSRTVAFSREELVRTAKKLGIEMPKNPGDVLYSFRYRNPLPVAILATQPEGEEWIIEGVGRAKYEFRLVPISRIAMFELRLDENGAVKLTDERHYQLVPGTEISSGDLTAYRLSRK